MVDLYEPLPSVLVGFVGGFLCPNRRSKGLSVGWGVVLEMMITKGTWYAWGSCMLAHLYRELHQVVYQRATSLSVGITLLQVWAWEHIAVTRPLEDKERPVFGYADIVVQGKLGKLEYWCRVLDDLDSLIWRSYLDCEPWPKDDREMPFVYTSRYLIGQTSFIIERFIIRGCTDSMVVYRGYLMEQRYMLIDNKTFQSGGQPYHTR